MNSKSMRLLDLDTIRELVGRPVFIVDSFSKTEHWEIIKAVESNAEGEKVICESGLHYDTAKYGLLEGWTAYEVANGVSAVDMRPIVRSTKELERYCRERKGQRVLIVRSGCAAPVSSIVIKEDAIHSYIRPTQEHRAAHVKMFSGDEYPAYNFGTVWSAFEFLPMQENIHHHHHHHKPRGPQTGDTKFCPRCEKAHFTYSEVFKSWACMDCGYVQHEAQQRP